ncbi:hypothetical protein BC628DRAFT_210563 [Trametes gibbosa]|nr:hypothetical protein BC628DRAFT_210563 [Trametes gibbosa]
MGWPTPAATQSLTPEPTSSTSTQSIRATSTAPVNQSQVRPPGLTKSTILALSISIGIFLIGSAAVMLLVVFRRRRSRATISCDTLVPFVVDDSKETKRSPDQGAEGFNSIQSVHNVSYRRGTSESPLLCNSPSYDVLAPSSTASPSRDHAGTTSESLDAQHGSALHPSASITSLPSGPVDPDLRPMGVHRGHPSSRAKLSLERRYPTAPSGSVPADEVEGTMLVRLPVTLARHVMATMSDLLGRGVTNYGGSENGSDSEPLPAYEPRSLPDVNASPS